MSGQAAILQIEERSLNALPSLQTVYLDGWILRFADGFMRRANSVNLLYAGALNLERKIATCEAAYRDRGYPHGIVFKITPLTPPEVVSALIARGYAHDSVTSIQTADLSHPLAAAQAWRVEIASSWSDAWLDGYFRMNRADTTKRAALVRMLSAIVPTTGYAQIVHDGAIIAVGLGVVEDDMIGLYDIVVDGGLRRRGVGRALVSRLLTWGIENSARTAYLQVMDENTPAKALYAGFGFTEAYRYSYLQRRFAATTP
ncbi:MAG: GNAT family N-acetyltransferase [Chloroflexota bacterium]|nr:GNAT family N-acetyltransferase [Chloroflexota bacterium]